MCISGEASMTTRLATSSTSAIRPSGIEDGASLSASSCGSFMSRAIAATRPAQRSVLTGPGLTAQKLMLFLPYWPASDIVRFCPAALAAPRADHHVDALLRQRAGNAFADPFAATRDQRGLAVELEVHVGLLCGRSRMIAVSCR